MGRDTGLVFESGDRWKLDTLIPDRDRVLIGPQIPRTSRIKVATKPVLIYNRLLVARPYEPIYSRSESMLDIQRRLRHRYLGDSPLKGDRLV